MINTSETKHTPGPWEMRVRQHVDELQSPIGESIHVTSYMGKIDVCQTDNWNPDYKANARLIASAPELLEALKRAEECMTENDAEKHGTITEDTKKIRRIISKAEGRE
jgi:hypothetical protein